MVSVSTASHTKFVVTCIQDSHQLAWTLRELNQPKLAGVTFVFNIQKYLIIISLTRLIEIHFYLGLLSIFQSSFSSAFTTFSCSLLIWTSLYVTILRNFTHFKRAGRCRTSWWLVSKELSKSEVFWWLQATPPNPSMS